MYTFISSYLVKLQHNSKIQIKWSNCYLYMLIYAVYMTVMARTICESVVGKSVVGQMNKM